LGCQVRKSDELHCLLRGLNFLLTHIPDEIYFLKEPASQAPSDKISWNIREEGDVFPYLLVNIGSGVSILKVDSPTSFERVSGSMIGGGTYWGLCRLACCDDKMTFEEAFALAEKGDAKKVNMLVSDIYGGDYKAYNLPGDVVASAFGKLMSKDDTRKDITTGDIARGLLDMIAMNVAQLAYLNAMRFRITRIIFAGNFLRQNDLSMAMISFAIHYWSQGEMKACFLKHEGYLGSLGVFLTPDDELESDTMSPHATTDNNNHIDNNGVDSCKNDDSDKNDNNSLKTAQLFKQDQKNDNSQTNSKNVLLSMLQNNDKN